MTRDTVRATARVTGSAIVRTTGRATVRTVAGITVRARLLSELHHFRIPDVGEPLNVPGGALLFDELDTFFRGFKDY